LESIYTIKKNLVNGLGAIKKIEINRKKDNKKEEEKVDNNP
jgi:hypothetical protein|tara:strand:- start:507 stop:629 length:123 start_codon:yes stop_codon:yes gene_type:complete